MPEGALARFTEGRRGMIHQEWNHGEVDAEIYILVATTDPIPEETSFEVLRREDMPLYPEAPGVVTREMVGPRSPLPVHCDVRLFADTSLGARSRPSSGASAPARAACSRCAPDRCRSTAPTWGPSGPCSCRPPRRRGPSPSPRPNGGRVLRAAFGPGYGLVTAG